jgi:ribosomal protein S18 acetylase RimI-like enzyme
MRGKVDKLVIRDYRSGDFPEIEKIWKATGMGGAVRGDDEKVIEFTLNQGGKMLLLENSVTGEIVGTSWMTQDGRRIYLHHFGIKREHQGKGYSHKLMKASMEYAESTGKQIKLEVHETNDVAIRLYKKWGFQFLGDYEVYIIRNYKSK